MPPLSYSYQYPSTYHKRIGSIAHIQKETEAAMNFRFSILIFGEHITKEPSPCYTDQKISDPSLSF